LDEEEIRRTYKMSDCMEDAMMKQKFFLVLFFDTDY